MYRGKTLWRYITEILAAEKITVSKIKLQALFQFAKEICGKMSTEMS